MEYFDFAWVNPFKFTLYYKSDVYYLLVCLYRLWVRGTFLIAF